MTADFPDILPAYRGNPAAADLIALLSSGGDARIVLDPESGLNRYLSAPYPRRTLAFASSTANDISAAAFEHLLARQAAGMAGYAEQLEGLGRRVLAAYSVTSAARVVFAPSGTDLEFVALAAVAGRGKAGTHNILLGADEVGSGCIHSAQGHYFAKETALGTATEVGEPVEGLGPVSLVDIPVRCGEGEALGSAEIAGQIRTELVIARGQGRHALLHVVHGSKTGLILPKLAELDALIAEFGEDMTLVVDACQARITSQALRDYLDRGAIVFITGSKFMGGPPFSGMALVPDSIIARAAPLPAGFATIFRRAEWGEGWQGREQLEDSANPGLALRLEASVFELERFQALAFAEVERVIRVFQRAIGSQLIEGQGFAMVQPYPPGREGQASEHPLEMQTLATLDISRHPQARTFDDAQALYRSLDRLGLRLGQPVKCVRLPEGGWGGTLRVGLSMPQVTELSALDDGALETALSERIGRFAEALKVPA
ncbi:hypothetical protein LY632_08020 [Erythrobacter sp. SDW2]|uniref:hypothetical protein n=1 Tax=Erythrobacter sp. SDW2 TaxID=2907154 RepID=UPI001F37A7FE|nr:hypothetical protein [Erythrobacter sp. SDW2]UIP05661.1 hypothetical protein LY632_08020 [Erythrobacter sp. SDW2]